MASLEDVKTQTGYIISSVLSVSHLNKIKFFIDESLKKFNNLFVAAGYPNCVF